MQDGYSVEGGCGGKQDGGCNGAGNASRAVPASELHYAEEGYKSFEQGNEQDEYGNELAPNKWEYQGDLQFLDEANAWDQDEHVRYNMPEGEQYQDFGFAENEPIPTLGFLQRQGAPGEQQGKKLQVEVSMSSDSKTNQEFIPMVLLMSATIHKVHFNGQCN